MTLAAMELVCRSKRRTCSLARLRKKSLQVIAALLVVSLSLPPSAYGLRQVELRETAGLEMLVQAFVANGVTAGLESGPSDLDARRQLQAVEQALRVYTNVVRYDAETGGFTSRIPNVLPILRRLEEGDVEPQWLITQFQKLRAAGNQWTVEVEQVMHDRARLKPPRSSSGRNSAVVLLEYLSEFAWRHLPTSPDKRAADNLAIVYWLYNRTGDKALLKLGEKIQRIKNIQFSLLNINDGTSTAGQQSPLPCQTFCNVSLNGFISLIRKTVSRFVRFPFFS